MNSKAKNIRGHEPLARCTAARGAVPEIDKTPKRDVGQCTARSPHAGELAAAANSISSVSPGGRRVLHHPSPIPLQAERVKKRLCRPRQYRSRSQTRWVGQSSELPHPRDRRPAISCSRIAQVNRLNRSGSPPTSSHNQCRHPGREHRQVTLIRAQTTGTNSTRFVVSQACFAGTPARPRLQRGN